MKDHQLYYLLILTLATAFTQAFAGKPTVIVSIPPQKAFIEALTGTEVDVIVLIQPGQNPTNFALSPRAMAEIGKASHYFSIGVPMETGLLPKLQSSYPQLKIVDTAAGIRKRSLESHFHDHGEGEDGHEHAQDPHIWLSPGLVKIQLRHYMRELVELLPENRTFLEENRTTFLEKLEMVDNTLKTTLRPLKGATVFVYHPAFGYFLERYGLKQETVEIEGKQPSPKQLRWLVKLAAEFDAKTIFVQPQFERKAAQTLADAIGGKVEIIDPLSEDYLDNLIHMGETILASY
jgi:zinc transport system substrate-binding protein